jgi:enamine deaminase RidA (YjgF/YER057c/UK114 family)
VRERPTSTIKDTDHADAIPEPAGASFREVVKMNLYVVGLKPELVPLLREVRARYVNRESPPASTLVGVSALVGADWLIEIEALAVVADCAAPSRSSSSVSSTTTGKP